jgi:hypothetical protein
LNIFQAFEHSLIIIKTAKGGNGFAETAKKSSLLFFNALSGIIFCHETTFKDTNVNGLNIKEVLGFFEVFWEKISRRLVIIYSSTGVGHNVPLFLHAKLSGSFACPFFLYWSD